MRSLLSPHSRSRTRSHSRSDSRPRPLILPGQTPRVRSLIAFFNHMSQGEVVASRPPRDRPNIPPNKVRHMVQSWLHVSTPSSRSRSTRKGGVVPAVTSHVSPLALRRVIEPAQFPPVGINARLHNVVKSRGMEERERRQRRQNVIRPRGREERRGERDEHEREAPQQDQDDNERLYSPVRTRRPERRDERGTYQASQQDQDDNARLQRLVRARRPVENQRDTDADETDDLPPRRSIRRRRRDRFRGHSLRTRSSSPSQLPSPSQMPITPPPPPPFPLGTIQPLTAPRLRQLENEITRPSSLEMEISSASPQESVTPRTPPMEEEDMRYHEPEAWQHSYREQGRQSPAARALSSISRRSKGSSWKGAFQSVRESFKKKKSATGGSTVESSLMESLIATDSPVERWSPSKPSRPITANLTPDSPVMGYVTAPDTFGPGTGTNIMSAVHSHVTRLSLMGPLSSNSGSEQERPHPQENTHITHSDDHENDHITHHEHQGRHEHQGHHDYKHSLHETHHRPITPAEPNTITAIGELPKLPTRPIRPRTIAKQRRAERRGIPDLFRGAREPFIRKESPLKPVEPLRVVKDSQRPPSTLPPLHLQGQIHPQGQELHHQEDRQLEYMQQGHLLERQVDDVHLAPPRTVTFDPRDGGQLGQRASIDTLASFGLEPPASTPSTSSSTPTQAQALPPPQARRTPYNTVPANPSGLSRTISRTTTQPNTNANPAEAARFESLSSLSTPPPNPPMPIRSPTLMREMAFPALRMRGDAGWDTTDTGGETVRPPRRSVDGGRGGGRGGRGGSEAGGERRRSGLVIEGRDEGRRIPRRMLYADTMWMAGGSRESSRSSREVSRSAPAAVGIVGMLVGERSGSRATSARNSSRGRATPVRDGSCSSSRAGRFEGVDGQSDVDSGESIDSSSDMDVGLDVGVGMDPDLGLGMDPDFGLDRDTSYIGTGTDLSMDQGLPPPPPTPEVLRPRSRSEVRYMKPRLRVDTDMVRGRRRRRE